MDSTNSGGQCMKTRVGLLSHQVQLYTNAFPLLPVTPFNKFFVKRFKTFKKLRLGNH